MLPWSVMATAGMPSSAARPASCLIFAAPSSIEYSVWTWRCTKESLATWSVSSVRLPIRGSSNPRPQTAVAGLARADAETMKIFALGGSNPTPRSVVDRLVGSGPEVEEKRQLARRGPALGHEDHRHVLGRVVVPGGAVPAPPSVAPGRGPEVRAPGEDRHPETPAHVRIERPPGDRLLGRRQLVAGHQRHRRPGEHPLPAAGPPGQQGRGEGEVI